MINMSIIVHAHTVIWHNRYLVDRTRWRYSHANTFLIEATPNLEKLQIANIHRGTNRRQFDTNEKRSQDIFVPAQDTRGS